MTPEENVNLESELEHFRSEKEKIRQIVGQVGGKGSAKQDLMINLTFLAIILVLFIFDILRHLFHMNLPLPPLLSIEMGVLLVSIKIIWMIYKQAKVEHFQFWILNSIEFRLNNLSSQINTIEKKLDKKLTVHREQL
ncbi:MAG TPA: hypothetical protein ENN20_00245 [Candidatus Marinimicrobia bacterium]|nr:hypothetical protein [Candidatus Neomarinimicrobiota bacterium]